MQDYFRSARFFTSLVSGVIAVSLLVGGLLALPYDGAADWYYVGVGAALCIVTGLLALAGRAALGAYALLLLGALAYTLAAVGLELWRLVPHLLVLVLWGGVLLALRHRIAPSRDAVADPRDSLRRRLRSARRMIRALN